MFRPETVHNKINDALRKLRKAKADFGDTMEEVRANCPHNFVSESDDSGSVDVVCEYCKVHTVKYEGIVDVREYKW